MRHYIKTLAMLLMVSLGFAACNDTDDFDDYKVNYPTSVPLGYYHSNYTPDNDYEYGVLLTKDADDNTVFQLIMEGKANGSDSASVRTLMVSSDLAYNDTIGVMTAISIEENFYENDMKAFLAYKKDLHHMILSVEYGKKKFSTVLAPTNEKPAVASKWATEGLVIDLKSIGTDTNKLPGTIASSFDDEEGEAITYSFNGENGEFTTESGTRGTFNYNDKMQLVVVFNGKTYTCDRTFSTPEPEVFNQIANGTYSHSVGVIEGGAVFNDVYEAGLFQSNKNPNCYIIQPWLNNADGLVVYVNPEDGKITVPQQTTGITDPQYGEMFAVDVANYTGGQVPSNSYFDGNVFHLDLAYVVSAGYFGFVNETYEITERAASVSKSNINKKNDHKFVSASNKLISKKF